MRLRDLLVPKDVIIKGAGAERADCADNQSGQGLWSPPIGAERGGLGADCGASLNLSTHFPPFPPLGADSETIAISDFPPFPPFPPNPPLLNAENEKRPEVSYAYFSSIGLNLLRDDEPFLERHLPKATRERETVLTEYSQIWIDAMEGEPEIRRQNVGRFAANTWLRIRC